MCAIYASMANRTQISVPDITDEEQFALLECFDNPRPERDYSILHTCHEFTSVCPKTGQPDFATFDIEYVADRLCLELKALKFYMQAYRNQGIFYEAVTNRILDDLVRACAPRYMKITGRFNLRGGFSSIIVAEHGARRGI
jgi:7-cyano-7-deazaguanine reductase